MTLCGICKKKIPYFENGYFDDKPELCKFCEKKIKREENKIKEAEKRWTLFIDIELTSKKKLSLTDPIFIPLLKNFYGEDFKEMIDDEENIFLPTSLDTSIRFSEVKDFNEKLEIIINDLSKKGVRCIVSHSISKCVRCVSNHKEKERILKELDEICPGGKFMEKIDRIKKESISFNDLDNKMHHLLRGMLKKVIKRERKSNAIK